MTPAKDVSAKDGSHAVVPLIALCGALAIGLAAATWGTGTSEVPPSAALLPETREILNAYDSSAQRKAYTTALMCYLGLVGLAALLPIELQALRTDWNRRVGFVVAIGLVAVTWITIAFSPPRSVMLFVGAQFGEYFVGGRNAHVAAAIAAVGGLTLLSWIDPGRRERILKLALWLVVAYAVVLAAFGWFRPFRLDDLPATLVSFTLDAHGSSVFGDRQQLTTGLQIFDTVQPSYGFLWPVLSAISERHLGWFSVEQSLRLVQVSQAVFLGVLIIALLRLPFANRLGVVVAILAVVPWVHSLHAAILMPNQSGMRFIGFPTLLLALGFAARLRSDPGAFLLGAVGSLAVLSNYETGVAVTFGAAFFVFLRQDDRSPVRSITLGLRFALAFMAIQALYWLVAFIGLGQAPRPARLLFWLLGSDVDVAHLGLQATMNPLMLLIAGHAAFAVGRALLTHRRRPLPASDAILGAAGASILIWMPYWSTRPDPWNVWSYVVLYTPFIVDLAGRTLAGSRPLVRPASVVLALALVPTVLLWQMQPIEAVKNALVSYRPPDEAKAMRVSGIWLERSLAEAALCKADLVKAAGVDGEVIYLTPYTFLITTLVGRPQPLPMRDTIFSVSTPARLDKLMADIHRIHPKRVLIDEAAVPDDILPAHRRLLNRIASALSGSYSAEAGFPDRWRALALPGHTPMSVSAPASCRSKGVG